MVSDSEFYQSDEDEIKKTLARLEKLQDELSQAYDRWEYLDSLTLQ